MKKIILLLSAVIFVIAVLACAAEVAKEAAKTELRPAQKLMQARAMLLTTLNKNLGAGNFEAVGKNAADLAAETKKTGEKLTNPLAKDITLAISMLAKDTSSAADKKFAGIVKVKLGAIKAKCDECHVKIRDKK